MSEFNDEVANLKKLEVRSSHSQCDSGPVRLRNFRTPVLRPSMISYEMAECQLVSPLPVTVYILDECLAGTLWVSK